MQPNLENIKSTIKRIFFTKYTKYIIVIFIFVVGMVFFDKHNVISRIEISRKTKEVKKEIDSLEKQIKDNKQKINELRSGGENVEKYAREQYLFKKNNEDVFIIDKKGKRK